MNGQRFFQALTLFGTALVMIGTLLVFRQEPSPNSFVAQNVNTYSGPSRKIPGNPQLVRVQVIVNDDPNPQGVQIVDAQFDQQTIPLKPRDIYGFRGQSSFQTAPGVYKLNWTVRRDRFAWPRTVKHEEEVTISPRDLWIQITITGEKANIS